jgi:hypothetical protein
MHSTHNTKFGAGRNISHRIAHGGIHRGHLDAAKQVVDSLDLLIDLSMLSHSLGLIQSVIGPNFNLSSSSGMVARNVHNSTPEVHALTLSDLYSAKPPPTGGSGHDDGSMRARHRRAFASEDKEAAVELESLFKRTNVYDAELYSYMIRVAERERAS